MIIWKDINFVAVPSLRGDHWIDWRVYEVTGWVNGGDVPVFGDVNFFGMDADTFARAEPVFTGFVKWDGCSEWVWEDSMHFCNKEMAMNMGVLMERLYEESNRLMGVE